MCAVAAAAAAAVVVAVVGFPGPLEVATSRGRCVFARMGSHAKGLFMASEQRPESCQALSCCLPDLISALCICKLLCAVRRAVRCVASSVRTAHVGLQLLCPYESLSLQYKKEGCRLPRLASKAT